MADAARAFEFVEDEDRALEEARAALLAESKRIVEALLFASAEPLEESLLGERLSDGADLAMTLAALREDYATRGVNLARAGTKWYFRTAEDLVPVSSGVASAMGRGPAAQVLVHQVDEAARDQDDEDRVGQHVGQRLVQKEDQTRDDRGCER